MAGIRDYNVKLKSLKNTRKITKTMKMVSASKLRKAQQAQVNAKLYAHSITRLISRISASVDPSIHPLLKKHPESRNVLILVVTSDKGLCGAFNLNCQKQVLRWLREHQSKYTKVDLSFCGKRGFMFFKKFQSVKTYYENVTNSPKFDDALRIGRDISESFIRGEYDEVYLAYNQFLSPIVQKTVFERILPLEASSLVEDKTPAKSLDYLFEPEIENFLGYLIPHFLYFKIYFLLLENAAGEHGARMAAMDNATKNASDLISRYTLLRNRARQAAITTELTEIVAGKEALN